MKKTPWFSIAQKPVRIGDYQMRWPGEKARRAHWDGGRWHARLRPWAMTPAAMPPRFPGGCSLYLSYFIGDEQWRGLTARHE